MSKVRRSISISAELDGFLRSNSWYNVSGEFERLLRDDLRRRGISLSGVVSGFVSDVGGSGSVCVSKKFARGGLRKGLSKDLFCAKCDGNGLIHEVLERGGKYVCSECGTVWDIKKED